MIYSMTGFGRAEVQSQSCKILVEIKSVNHRYFECGVKVPKKYSQFEANVRRLLKSYAVRGKIDVYISYENDADADVSLLYHEELAAKYLEYGRMMEERFGISNDLTVSKLLRFPEIITMEEQKADEERLWKDLEEAVCVAASQFREMRGREGERLLEDLLAKLDQLDQNVDLVIKRSPGILEDYKARLKEKTKELLGDAQIEESRIAAEVILFADKICTDEETVRLKSHIRSMRETLLKGGEIGRKLDFLAQEMNREANTILSKSNDLETSDIAVELKTEIEKIREQIQNIE